MSDWISIEEKMPVDGIKVLSVGEDGMHVSFTSSGGWVREGDQDNFCLFGVTHWMSLPSIPEKERNPEDFNLWCATHQVPKVYNECTYPLCDCGAGR